MKKTLMTIAFAAFIGIAAQAQTAQPVKPTRKHAANKETVNPDGTTTPKADDGKLQNKPPMAEKAGTRVDMPNQPAAGDKASEKPKDNAVKPREKKAPAAEKH